MERIFEALSHCAALHPDQNGGVDTGEGDFEGFDDDEAFMDGDEELNEEELSEVGRVRSDKFASSEDSRFKPY